MGAFKKRIEHYLKHNVVFGSVFRFSVNCVFRFLRIFYPIKKNTILFTALGKGYNDSPRAIYEKIISDNRFADFTFYWGVDDVNAHIPGNPMKIKIDSWKYFKTAFKCQYWIACVNIERSFRFKKRKQIYLNTDHGVPIKKFGNQVKGRKDFNFKHINYFCVSGEFEANMYPDAYSLNPANIIRTGLPRNDELYSISKSEICTIRETLNLTNKRIILYAPTWRDSSDAGKTFQLKPPIDFKKWERCLGNKYVVLLRTHPYTTKLLGVDFNGFVQDFSTYPKVNDLIKVADILISDYSAIIFDYAITEKPMLCFAYDYEEYASSRGLVIDLKKEFPCGIVEKEDDLLNRILSMDYEKMIKEVKDFKTKYIEYGGNASSMCIDSLLRKTKI